MLERRSRQQSVLVVSIVQHIRHLAGHHLDDVHLPHVEVRRRHRAEQHQHAGDVLIAVTNRASKNLVRNGAEWAIGWRRLVQHQRASLHLRPRKQVALNLVEHLTILALLRSIARMHEREMALRNQQGTERAVHAFDTVVDDLLQIAVVTVGCRTGCFQQQFQIAFARRQVLLQVADAVLTGELARQYLQRGSEQPLQHAKGARTAEPSRQESATTPSTSVVSRRMKI